MYASNVENSAQNRTSHQFVPRLGYVAHSRLPDGSAVGSHQATDTPCQPPKGVIDGSDHMLSAPGSERLLRFTWRASENAWERAGGARMAYPAAYLAKQGWAYRRAATAVIQGDLA